MARRRYYRRSYRPALKKKWASNIIQDTVTTSNYKTLVQNSSQTSQPTPVIVKCGNFKVQGDVYVQVTGSTPSRPIPLIFYILFVPEGVTPSDSLVGNHPEWIMGWTAIDSGIIFSASAENSGNKFSITTRLKRNLNSGDRIVALLQSRDASATAQAAYTCQYWTCAN